MISERPKKNTDLYIHIYMIYCVFEFFCTRIPRLTGTVPHPYFDALFIIR